MHRLNEFDTRWRNEGVTMYLESLQKSSDGTIVPHFTMKGPRYLQVRRPDSFVSSVDRVFQRSTSPQQTADYMRNHVKPSLKPYTRRDSPIGFPQSSPRKEARRREIDAFMKQVPTL